MTFHSSAKPRTSCRVCGSDHLELFLDLGEMPLVNRYLDAPEETATEPRFPLEIAFCSSCWLSQLTYVVDPAVLYANYAYHSSVSSTFVRHCHGMAETLIGKYSFDSTARAVEIASNDGCMQRAFRASGVDVLGVEPAENLALLAQQDGLRTLARFWDAEAAVAVVQEQGLSDLVLATNVVAHVDDLLGFFSAIRASLAPAGVFVFEVPYLVPFIKKTEFDTTYHEHLSYFLLTPLKRALEQVGLELIDVQEFEIHGGSIRVHVSFPGQYQVMAEVGIMLQKEADEGFLDATLYRQFGQHVKTVRDELVLFLQALRQSGKKIVAYGASAKGNVLVNYCQFEPGTITCVLDDTPAKQGRFFPGSGLPIVSRDILATERPDYIVLLAWNFAEELMANLASFKTTGGRFIIPIPGLRIV